MILGSSHATPRDLQPSLEAMPATRYAELIANDERKIWSQIFRFPSPAFVERQLNRPFSAAIERKNAGILHVGERINGR